MIAVASSTRCGPAARRRAWTCSQRGATQEGLAYEAGITTGTLSQLERGISNPSWGTLKAIAGALGVSMANLAKLATKLES
jgi:transcriptional regulator with XRE-family HTH domain